VGKSDTQQTQQSSTSAPWLPAQPMLMNLLSQYGSLNTAPTSGQSQALSALTNATSSIPNFGGQAAGAVSNLFNSNVDPQIGMLKSAYGTLNKNLGATASGAELDPYATPGFSDALHTLTSDITNSVKGVYSGSGRDPTGAGSFAGSLGRGLMQGEAPVIQAQYNQNKTNQMNAANQLFGAGGSTASGITGQQQVPLSNAAQALGLLPSVTGAYTMPASAQLDAANMAQNLPFQNLSQMLGPAVSIAGLGGQNQGTSTTSVSQDPTSNIMGGVAGTIGILKMLSDERAKDNIEEVGELRDGQKVYSYNYKGDDLPQIGLLAQEVERTVPGAVAKGPGGMRFVDYHHATRRAARMARKAA
jgi:hypothetical protein